MKGVLVDSNVILDVFLNDLKWACQRRRDFVPNMAV
jgi:hypothetical protein